jgi:hypothetical protein
VIHFSFKAQSSIRYSCALLLLAIVLSTACVLLQARSGFNLADEGFLWYGVQQTARGQVPLRDFQSYDPGRYYWSALGSFLFGKGLVALRISEAAVQIVGLWAALMAARRVARSWTVLLAIGCTLTIWMFPSHKLFDHALLLCGISVAVCLAERPTNRQIFIGGIFVGLCFFFGRNHALYNFLAQAFLLLLLRCKGEQRLTLSTLGSWIAGLALGLLPLVTMLLLVPGFAATYVESIRSMLSHPANLPLPVPWPWRFTPSGNSIVDAQQFLLGILFVALPLISLVTVALCVFGLRLQSIKEHALFVAGAFVGLFYMHHAFSRPDLSHLAQAIHPFIFAAISIPVFRERYRFVPVAAFLLTGIFLISMQTLAYQRWKSPVAWVACDTGDNVFVPPSTSRQIECVRQFAQKHIAPREGVLIAPFAPGLYPIVGRQAPLWDLAFYFPATTERQNQMIQELEVKNVNWAIISDSPEDRRPFSATHELLWQYLVQNFESIESACLPRSMKIFRRRSSG